MTRKSFLTENLRKLFAKASNSTLKRQRVSYTVVDTLESAVELYYCDLKRIVRSFVSDATTADDLCQEVFARFCQKFQSGTVIPDTWVYLKGLLRLVWLEQRRASQKLQLMDSSAEDMLIADSTPDSDVEETESLVHLQAVLPLLSPEDKSIIMGRYFLGMSGTETANWLNMPRTTFLDRERQAMERLKWMAKHRGLIP